MFLDIWHLITNWLNRRRRRTEGQRGTKPQPTIAKPPETPPVEAAKDLAESANDLIRYFEKQRLKHDKFVTPNGELPKREPKPRPITQEVKPRIPKPDIEPAIEPASSILDQTDLGIYLAEPHHEDKKKVLYKLEEALGEFNFRDTILQQLDRYFFYLKRMKKHDRETYGLYRQVGATILPYLATGAWNRSAEPDPDPDKDKPIPPLPAWFNAQRPGFGCFAYGTDPETEKFEQTWNNSDRPKIEMWVPKFMYFVKYELPPPGVQPIAGGDIYSLTIWWDRPGKKCKHGIPQSLPIFISRDGKTVRALKMLKTDWISIRSKRGRFSVPSRQWHIPKDYRQWAKQHEEEVHHFLTRLFIESIAQSENSHMSMTRIAVTKDRMTAVFSVNIRRTAYFFQDRDISVTQSGTRKPVFHLVRPHVRKDGTTVKMHFRGIRDFTWAGYDVHISVPGLDHADINQFEIGVVDEAGLEDKAGMITLEQLGTELADHIRRGWAA